MPRAYLNACHRLRSIEIVRKPVSGRWSSSSPSSFYIRRFFSTEERPTNESTNEEETISPEESSSSTPNDVIFPWRHEFAPLPRLVEGTIDHATRGHLLSSVTTQTGSPEMNMLASAFMFLDVPLYQFLFFSSWRGELADSMSWAFTQGVAGLLSNLASHSGEFCVLGVLERPLHLSYPKTKYQ